MSGALLLSQIITKDKLGGRNIFLSGIFIHDTYINVIISRILIIAMILINGINHYTIHSLLFYIVISCNSGYNNHE